MALDLVTTTLGKLTGVPQNGKYSGNTVFMSIPYAAPPVGALRWKPPQKAEPWTGVRACCTHAPAACQLFASPDDQPYGPDFYYLGTPSISEDCLYLDITTGAAAAGEKRPVFVWFHGGGLNFGWEYEIEFDGNELARKGVVVVSVAQRLNSFGYLALPQLTAEQGKSGNYGLMDQMMALDWIRENIAAFGGDPEQITVGGQSGGSLKACMLAGSPVTSRFIKGCIPQSGLKLLQKFPTPEEACQKGREFLSACGIDPDASLEELRAIPAERFLIRGIPLPGEMVCDGELVPFPVMKDCLDAYAGDIHFLCGCNLGESSPLDGSSLEKIATREDFYAHFRELLGDLYEQYDFESLVPVTEEDAWHTARELASHGLCRPGRVNFSRNLMLDRLFGMDSKRRHPNRRVYTYLFTHRLPARPEDYGTARDPETLMVYHSSEMFYTFSSLREGVPPIRPWKPEDFVLADLVSSYWANFIKSGDPNSDKLPCWPQAGDDYGWIKLDSPITPAKGLSDKLEELTAEYVRRAYKIG